MSIENNFTNHTVIIHDNRGVRVAETYVVDYDNVFGSIRIKEQLQLETGDKVQLLILTSPSPCAFHGNIGPKIQNMTTISLHSGKSKEDRIFERFAIDSAGTIEGVIRNSEIVIVPNTKVQLKNISQGGVRFSGAFGLLCKNDEILLRMETSKTDQILTAEVVNSLDVPSRYSEYGCRFSNINHANFSPRKDIEIGIDQDNP